jgi:hypothetical protein
MPVEDRIRQGLDANASAVTSLGVGRLAAVHGRRRRTNVIASLTGTAAALVAGVAVQVVGTPSSAGPAPSPAGPVEQPAAAAAPFGGYLRDVTAKEGLALGVPRRRVERLTGRDGRLELGLKLQQGTFTLWTNDDAGRPTAWDAGSYVLRPGHRLVATTISDRCPSCTTRLTWQDKGDDIVFTSVTRTRSGRLARWLWGGTWDFQAR